MRYNETKINLQYCEVIHMHDIYDNYNAFVLKYAFLSFDKPEHWYTSRTGGNFLIYVESGTATITIRNETITASEGQYLFVPDNETSIVMLFTGTPFRGYEISFRFFPNVALYQYRFQLVEPDQAVRDMMYEIPTVQPVTTTVVWRFYRFISHLQPYLTPCDQKRLDVIKEALRYMESHDEYDLSTLAAHCNLKERQFQNIFKQVTGNTPILEKQRIQAHKAEYLLKRTDLSIKEIAESLGYRSESYFRKVFRSRYNISPATYRKKISSG